jgi:hypothetical protein
MEASNDRLGKQPTMKNFPFKPMPEPRADPTGFIRPRRVSIVYLGG